MEATAPERLTEAERAWHQRVHAEVVAASAVWQRWGAWLAERYHLGEGDVVHEDGTITRGGEK